MTNGTSQGLLVIVAVVIFGLFVGLSYILFQDQLQTGLTQIFTESIDNSKKIVGGKNGGNGDN